MSAELNLPEFLIEQIMDMGQRATLEACAEAFELPDYRDKFFSGAAVAMFLRKMMVESE